MTRIINWVHTWESGFDEKVEHLVNHHPYFMYVAMFIGIPVFVLGAVFLSTGLILLPFGLILGWF